MSQLPICVQYLTAISTPIIALMVAMIAFAQWRTARQRMILDLFQRRMDLVDVVSRIASSIVMEGARLFGFDRTGSDLKEAIDQQCATLVQMGRLHLDGDVLRLGAPSTLQ